MFEYPLVKGADNYLLQIAEDGPSPFSKVVVEQRDSATATFISNLQFGKRYRWRYTGIKDTKQLGWNGLYYFEITEDSFIHRQIIALTVSLNDSNANAGGLIINDCTHTIVDRTGKVVWYLPKVNWFFTHTGHTQTIGGVTTAIKNVDIKPGIFDLRLNLFGTITELEDSVAFERGLDGTILWKAPNDNKVSGIGGEAYNHDFKRLPNGHYMLLGNQLLRKVPTETFDTVYRKRRFEDREFIDGQEYSKVECGTVIEYDKQKNVVWSWNSHDYLQEDPLKPKLRNHKIEFPLKPHINAFSIDKDYRFVYVSFRDLSRIVKIEKSTGKVIDSWGFRQPNGGANHEVCMHLQHDANILSDGSIAVFNSNDYPKFDTLPTVLLISQKPADSGKVIWQYTCQLDTLERFISRNGGNVDELKNGNLLVCTGTVDRIFEITRDKKIVWQANIKSNKYDNENYGHRLYRAHYLSSLYPCYFTCQTDKDTITTKASTFNIKIFNKGSEADSYNIQLSSGKYLQQVSTQNVSSNHSALVKINSGKHLQKGNLLDVIVTSQTNPYFQRKIQLIIK